MVSLAQVRRVQRVWMASGDGWQAHGARFWSLYWPVKAAQRLSGQCWRLTAKKSGWIWIGALFYVKSSLLKAILVPDSGLRNTAGPQVRGSNDGSNRNKLQSMKTVFDEVKYYQEVFDSRASIAGGGEPAAFLVTSRPSAVFWTHYYCITRHKQSHLYNSVISSCVYTFDCN